MPALKWKLPYLTSGKLQLPPLASIRRIVIPSEASKSYAGQRGISLRFQMQGGFFREMHASVHRERLDGPSGSTTGPLETPELHASEDAGYSKFTQSMPPILPVTMLHSILPACLPAPSCGATFESLAVSPETCDLWQ
jgi:hypothetical protein